MIYINGFLFLLLFLLPLFIIVFFILGSKVFHVEETNRAFELFLEKFSFIYLIFLFFLLFLGKKVFTYNSSVGWAYSSIF